MKFLSNSYQAYERRGIRGEMDSACGKPSKRTNLRGPLLAPFGDLLNQIGQNLNRYRVVGKPTAWSPLTGSKP